ncbi:putative fatty acyl-CoA reductase 4 [Senna tora]|uniref:Fatty acyl-CoA reductase n=1 Tax=Senna tora TaxID=362788 RepID=A0A834WIX7_9FABA|nr:putative fatty acyl-CoA reductase 4 [Senna tora]
MGQTLNGTSKFDIDTEKKMMQQIIQQLQAQNVGENTISSIMKDYGIKRANMYGWPNTYVFTKAMGEMLMSHFKDKIPLIIIRPTMVSSTYKEPFPGWIEGYRTVDALIGGYGKGKVPCFVGNPQTILDVNLLYAFNLSANGLTVEVPSEIGRLKMLLRLGLSCNNLSASIKVLEELPSLVEANISFNSFHGPVPHTRMKLLNSHPSSFLGNPNLCITCLPLDNMKEWHNEDLWLHIIKS